MADRGDLSFKWEWLPGGAIRTPELNATFARLEIFVGDECVSLVQDVDSGSSRRSLQVALYPLAEWIAFNWWQLIANSRPARERLQRHARNSFQASGDGFLWPDLQLIPEGERTRLQWSPDRRPPAGAPALFLAHGESWTDSATLQGTLSRFVNSVSDRLIEQDVRDTPLHREWEVIQKSDEEETEFCIAAARLGLNPYGDAKYYESSIVKAAESLPFDVLSSFFDAVDPSGLDGAVAWLNHALSELAVSPSATTRMRELQRAGIHLNVPSYDQPWQIGWTHARRVRSALGVANDVPFSFDDLLRAEVAEGGDRRIKAVGKSGESSSRVVFLSRPVPEISQRFTLARALWHHVNVDEPLFIVTDSYTDRQKVERAFAAELLAPAAGMKELLEVEPSDVESEDIDSLAEIFAVSTTVVERQLKNQLIG